MRTDDEPIPNQGNLSARRSRRWRDINLNILTKITVGGLLVAACFSITPLVAEQPQVQALINYRNTPTLEIPQTELTTNALTPTPFRSPTPEAREAMKKLPMASPTALLAALKATSEAKKTPAPVKPIMYLPTRIPIPTPGSSSAE